MTISTPGSIKALLDAVTGAEAGLNAPGVLPSSGPGSDEIVVYRWRPRQVDPPCLYHMVASAPFEQRDQARWRDTLNLLARLAMPMTNDEEEMEALEVYSDAFREVMDPVLSKTGNPMGGAATWADRTDMRSVVDDFNDVPYLCMEFLLSFRLDRRIDPN